MGNVGRLFFRSSIKGPFKIGQGRSKTSAVCIELAGGAHFGFPFCSHLQPLASGCQVAASDCYFCPENIMISPHAVLKKTTISAMLFCEEILVFSRAARGEIITVNNPRLFREKIQTSAELATKESYSFYIKNSKYSVEVYLLECQVAAKWLPEQVAASDCKTNNQNVRHLLALWNFRPESGSQHGR